MTATHNILIAHRSPLYRQGLRMALHALAPDGHTEDAGQLRDLNRCWHASCAFDLLLLDDVLPGLACLCKLQQLVERHRAPILLLSENRDITFVRRLKKTGVSGLLPQAMDENDLRQALAQLHDGVGWIQPGSAVPPRPSPGDSLQRLTAAEHRVLQLLGDGLANKQIAAALNLTEYTVKTHLGRIFRKFNVGNRTHLAATLQQLQLQLTAC